ncbi:DUF1349 domain-containing protein [Glycomyces buryatensis]|uniref:DUF1349 domain-containing protein n=1 Tax=Glycomyces buryatensis TaxID=2570927 RepID=A0A4S8Q1X4_9ACTN|nr:DUF1349 domain-containing protein [Glycomyces buryatensis]
MPVEVPWKSGVWTTLPVAAAERDGHLVVTAAEGSDAWRHTSYGFVHDNEHALLTDWDREQAVEVTFTVDYDGDFDQAGMLIRADEEHWIKTGVEFSDGALGVGAVVTDIKSDWSNAPVPEWAGTEVTIRVSRIADGVVIRAKSGDEPWRLVRLAPVNPELELQAGPYCAAPTRSGLTVDFASWRLTEPDAEIH